MKRYDEQTQEIIESKSKNTIIELQAKVIQNKEEELANLIEALLTLTLRRS
jgi:hypothetical protein